MENTKTQKGKIIKFDGTTKRRLSSSAQKRLDEGKYLSSLRLMNRYHGLYSGDMDSFAMQADAYEVLECFPQAINAWYRFLDVSDESSLADAYEGLAVNYMNLGKEAQAAYYYNQLLQVDKEITEESKMEIMETFSKPKKSLFKTVYPPEKADYTEQLDEGLSALKEGKYAFARQVFREVPRGAKQYAAAQNLVAVSYLLDEQIEEAKKICEALIAERADDVQANTTYAAVLGQLKEKDEARRVAKRLCAVQTEDTDELYKIATVCCENELHEEALEKFTQLEEQIPSDKNVLYFKGVAAYKSGKTKLFLSTFENLLTLFPEASVARYYYDAVRRYEEEKDKAGAVAPELTYFYAVPQEVRGQKCNVLAFLRRMNRREAQWSAELDEVNELLEWAFDEADGGETEAQLLAADVAVRCECTRFLQRTLLRNDVSDGMKVQILQRIAQNNQAASYGVVIYHIYRRVNFYHIRTGKKNRKKFLSAFSVVYARFAFLSDGHARRICAAGELLYQFLTAVPAFDWQGKTNDLAAVVYLLSGIKEGGGTVKSAVEFFEASPENVEEIFKMVKSVTERKLSAEKKKEEGEGDE